MKLLKQESLWLGTIYFLTLLSIALWVRDIPNQPDAYTVTLEGLIKTSTMSDPASFATAAIDIAKNGWISPENQWIFNLWPPGFVLLEASILKVMGHDTPAILVLQILAALLFAIVLTQLHAVLKPRINNKAAAFFPLLIFAFPVSRVFLLEPKGITLGESFSVGFFLLFVLLVLRATTAGAIRYAAYAGLCLALSAYFRSQYEIILMSLTGCGILLAILSRFTLIMGLNGSLPFKSPSVKVVALALFVAHATTIPWRLYHWSHQHGPVWVTTSTLTFENSVRSTEYLESIRGEWVVAGGGNLTCRISPDTCGDTANAKTLLFKTFMAHPGEWYRLKSEAISEYWFSSTQNWGAVIFQPTFMDFVTNGLLLIFLAVTVGLLLTRKVRSHVLWPVLIWINVSLISAYALIFTFAHFEVRYFYFPKIAGMFMLPLVLSLYFDRREQYRSASVMPPLADAY